MNLTVFKQCFETLCLSFDLDPEKKMNRAEIYFSSELGNLTEIAFLDTIKKAKETLSPKAGYLPPVRELIRLYYSTVSKPEKQTDEKGNIFKHELCGGTGKVTLLKNGYEVGGFACTCEKGKAWKAQTLIGQDVGFYTDWLDKGYSLPEGSVPF